jgi:hypothetical protein
MPCSTTVCVGERSIDGDGEGAMIFRSRRRVHGVFVRVVLGQTFPTGDPLFTCMSGYALARRWPNSSTWNHVLGRNASTL